MPILGGPWLAGLVRGGGVACQLGGCQVGMAGQLVGPVPTPHGAIGGQLSSAGYGPASDGSASVQPSEGRTKAWCLHRDTTSR